MRKVWAAEISVPKTNAAEGSAAFFGIAGPILSRSFFEQSLLHFFLALDAVAGPGDGFEALGVDLFAAMDAFAEAAFADAGKSLVDHLQGLAVVIALAKQELFGVGTGGA